MKPYGKMLLPGVAFMCLLLAGRMYFTQTPAYVFLAWNTFLAFVPLMFSSRLQPAGKPGIRNMLLLAGWLLFFPNAPYVLTDLFHFHAKPPAPKWFDLILLSTAAWNGLWTGMISLMQVERFLEGMLPRRAVYGCLATASLLCGYGIYIGRFLRFNSWDIFTAPQALLGSIALHFIHPFRHAEVWGFTVLFAAMFALFYAMLKKLRSPALC
ncbi:DUF1361 domain-containing protein [Chitinophaga sp. GCM10012297]|uniref:DUF1361 domain-containing protein n=1 Tax=Chitinophaga chungangae TaxID=2821488 RepID=A0ABS3YAV6_9BACT|nr:DUF1361 domain-containing protein [Chitinophaga chungangae]MBO9151812.1 DUF1361 domain-containing protein [Chitinophaga chungangae]